MSTAAATDYAGSSQREHEVFAATNGYASRAWWAEAWLRKCRCMAAGTKRVRNGRGVKWMSIVPITDFRDPSWARVATRYERARRRRERHSRGFAGKEGN